ncbi:SAM-dependent methyltransferase [Cryptosporangium minutisporangium]|uniref:SAM-dependent methyltransferase n=1 Tax=Cryptosporangium minutisporangium TaxID=113569 RepID=A0ABP6T718_9ACTN
MTLDAASRGTGWSADGRQIDVHVAHPARRYDYWLGGQDNFAADRASGDAVAAVFPSIRVAAAENRGFLRRAIRYLTADAGVRQFLDVGTGLPTANNTHDIAQTIAPEARIVYVDNDPLVLVHARALLTSAPRGRTAYLDADLRDPDSILGHEQLPEILNFGEPVGLVLAAILHFIADADDPARLVRHYLDALPRGSYLVLSHAACDDMDPATAEAVAAAATSNASGAFQLRTHDQISRFFDGLTLVPPGLTSTATWRADHEPEPRPADEEVSTWAGVAYKS